MNERMFCFQCQETAGGTGCKLSGVCGKNPEVAHAQDLLIYVLKGLGVIANHHQHGCGHEYCDFRKSIHNQLNESLQLRGLSVQVLVLLQYLINTLACPLYDDVH